MSGLRPTERRAAPSGACGEQPPKAALSERRRRSLRLDFRGYCRDAAPAAFPDTPGGVSLRRRFHAECFLRLIFFFSFSHSIQVYQIGIVQVNEVALLLLTIA